jgi:hypothetical protein
MAIAGQVAARDVTSSGGGLNLTGPLAILEKPR